MAGQTIGSLNIVTKFDGSAASEGLAKLTNDLAKFGSDSEKYFEKFNKIGDSFASLGSAFSSLGKFAGFSATAFGMANLVSAATKFADQLERAKANSSIAFEVHQKDVEWKKSWDEMGNVGKVASLPGRFGEASQASLGRAMSEIGTLLPTDYLDHVNKKLTEIREGERGWISGIARMVPVLSELDQLSDMIVPWGKDGWGKNVENANWGKWLPALRKDEKPVFVDDNREIKTAADNLIEETRRMLASPAEQLQIKLDELESLSNYYRYADFMDQTGTNDKFKEALAAIEKRKEFIQKAYKDAEQMKEIAEQQEALMQLNEEAVQEQQERAKTMLSLEVLSKSGLTGYEEFVRKNNDIITQYEELAGKLSKPEDFAKARAARDRLLANNRERELAQGFTNADQFDTERLKLLADLNKANADGDNQMVQSLQVRLGRLYKNIAESIPEFTDPKPIAGYLGRGTQDEDRAMIMAQFPPEQRTMQERFNAGLDKLIEASIEQKKIGEDSLIELKRIAIPGKAKVAGAG